MTRGEQRSSTRECISDIVSCACQRRAVEDDADDVPVRRPGRRSAEDPRQPGDHGRQDTRRLRFVSGKTPPPRTGSFRSFFRFVSGSTAT